MLAHSQSLCSGEGYPAVYGTYGLGKKSSTEKGIVTSKVFQALELAWLQKL